MATLVASKPATSVDHIQRFEGKLQKAKQALAALPGDEYYTQLIGIIHKPGWTTPAEAIFFEVMVDSILLHTQSLAQLHERLRTASEAVGAE